MMHDCKRTILGAILLTFCWVTAGWAQGAEAPLFVPRIAYCKDHADICKNLPNTSIAPKTIVVMHGMDSSMDSRTDGAAPVPTGNYVRLLQFLTDLGRDATTGKVASDFHVYGVDYNSSSYGFGFTTRSESKSTLDSAQPIRLVQLNTDTDGKLASTCVAPNWENCWTVVEQSDKTYCPSNATNNCPAITLRNVGDEIRNLLIKAAKDKDKKLAVSLDPVTGLPNFENPVMIVAHSMGGLVARDLLYNSSVNQEETGYEELLKAGVWVNEYVSLGTPHIQGLFSDFDNELISAVQKGGVCLSLPDRLAKIYPLSAQVYQFCTFEHWNYVLNNDDAPITWQDGARLSIDRLDFPQIHWVYVAGLAGGLLPDPLSIGDTVVSYLSAQKDHSYAKDGIVKDAQAAQRAHQHLYLSEYADQDSVKTGLQEKGSLFIPGKTVGTIGKYNIGHSGFVQGVNVLHNKLMNVGYYYTKGPMSAKAPIERFADCSFTGDIDNEGVGVPACFGYFQYVVPSTTLCRLPGFRADNDYYTRNPQFYPQHGEILGFSEQCRLEG